ncbi:hypothetical protein [Mycobacterium riyadhense]|uniref:hypothetical protein n=1 Tax=Mycobacterium riyadhense TaxID=486698 RepID=UPI00194F23C3|nr:hypothetical protein [Mycobacterium riyadhense]
MAAGLVCLSAPGCGRVTGGSAETTAHSDPAEPVPGIAPTLPDHIPPDALSCIASPIGNGLATTATVSDPAAPRITISVPDGWNSAAGTGDTALTLTGPKISPALWHLGTTNFAHRADLADELRPTSRGRPQPGAFYSGAASRKISVSSHTGAPQVIPEGAGPVKTTAAFVFACFEASWSWLGASK